MQKFFMKSENFCLYYLKFPYICSIILYKRRKFARLREKRTSPESCEEACRRLKRCFHNAERVFVMPTNDKEID